MRLLAFIPIKLTLLLTLGILIGYYTPVPQLVWLCALVSTTSVLGIVHIFYKKLPSVLFAFVAACTTLLLGTYVSTRAKLYTQSSHFSHIEQIDSTVFRFKIIEVLKTTAFSERYFAEVTQIDNKSTTGKILLSKNLKDSLPSLEIDDEILVCTPIKKIIPPLNPHQFNYKNYLEKLGVYHQLKLAKDNYIITENTSTTLSGSAAKIRIYIMNQLATEGFDAEELSVMYALLLGERSSISPETYTSYKNAGAVHILAVSGLHIGVLLLLIQLLLKPLYYVRDGKTLTLILTILLLWGYAFIAGLSPSIIRACTMFSFVAYALHLNRPSNTYNILSLSILFILLFINPLLLFQVGFQMSYAAVFAIVWIYPLLQKFWQPSHFIMRYFWQLLSVSIAAQVGVLPISLFYFHQFPTLFFISNLLVIPALGFILGFGILTILLSLINQLPTLLVQFFNELLSYMNLIVHWVGNQEAFIIKAISFDAVQLILSYFVLVTLITLLNHIQFKNTFRFLCCLLVFQCYAVFKIYETSTTKEVLLLHQIKNTVLIERFGNILKVRTQDSLRSQRLLMDYAVGERIKKITYAPLRNSYFIAKNPLLIIDSLAVYPQAGYKNTILLTGSPKLHLERLITITNPTSVIADGSNYPSFIERWKNTCLEYQIPFYNTADQGYYNVAFKNTLN